MSRLLRMIALDPCARDVRRLRDCLSSRQGVCASLLHLSDPSRAIARLPKMQADLLFIDEDLERMTGVETIRALRAAGERRPIVGTAQVDCGYLAADMVRAGADGYLAKQDLGPAMVRRVIDRALQHAARRNAGERFHRRAVQRMAEQMARGLVGLS